MGTENNSNRRDFLGKALGALAVAALTPLTVFLKPRDVLAANNGFLIDLNSQKYSELNAVDGSYWIIIPNTKEVLRNGDILPYAFVITRTSPSDFSALLGWCTHQNSALNAYDAARKLIACTNTDFGHGSTYDINGIILGGPAHADLTQYSYMYYPTNNTLEVFIPGLAVKDGEVRINALELFQNFPNPAKEITTLPFKTLYYSKVTLTVTDSLGHIIAVLHDGGLPAGDHSFDFNTSIFPAGMYYYHLTGNGQTQTKKMVVVR